MRAIFLKLVKHGQLEVRFRLLTLFEKSADVSETRDFSSAEEGWQEHGRRSEGGGEKSPNGSLFEYFVFLCWHVFGVTFPIVQFSADAVIRHAPNICVLGREEDRGKDKMRGEKRWGE